jgi:hypothetical protein
MMPRMIILIQMSYMDWRKNLHFISSGKSQAPERRKIEEF